MDLNKIIRELRSEHDALSYAISALEAVGQQGKKRRGRPPKWLAALKNAEPDSEPPEENETLHTETRKPKPHTEASIRKAVGRARGHG